MMQRSVMSLATAVSLAALVGCASPPKPLYQWDSFVKQQYSTLLREGANPDEQIRVLEMQVEKSRAANTLLPPGFLAHMGMIYLESGNPVRARELWNAEKMAFPEASPYMDRLLQRLDKPAQANKIGASI